MAQDTKSAVRVQPTLVAPTKHPIKAARLLYSAPGFVLRGPIYMVALMLFTAVAYSFWAKKDILVTAPLVLEKQTTVIESVRGGLVTDIAARPNSMVRVGDRLVTVQEQTSIAATPVKQSLTQQKLELEKERARVEDEFNYKIAQVRLQLEDIATSGETTQEQAVTRVRLLEEELAQARRALRRRKETLAVAQTQFERKKALFDNRDITIAEFEAAQERLNEAKKQAEDAQSVIAQVKGRLNAARTELAALGSLRKKEILEKELAQLSARKERELLRLDNEIDALQERLLEAETLIEGVTYDGNLAYYTTLFDGLITDVHVKPGEVIVPGTPLVSLVKRSAALEARVLVDNKDIGLIRRGQDVKIKYFAYPYQEYGIHRGRIAAIARKPDQDSKYVVNVVLNKEVINGRSGRPKPLEIGLEGIAEIKTGEKRFIELVFSPISKFLRADGSD